MVIELCSILEPSDYGPWFSRGHANERNFVAQYELVIEMRGLCYAGTLRKKENQITDIRSLRKQTTRSTEEYGNMGCQVSKEGIQNHLVQGWTRAL